LLWTQGNLAEVADGKNFYKEGGVLPDLPAVISRVG